ncbi:MAG: trypsin-like peptidase domain-containing protein [Sedimenticolaceae bacterium]|jgi:serine protease DegS
MRLYRTFTFVFTSIATGLAAAFLVLVFKPDFLGEPQYSASPVMTLARQEGPVSYADAVQKTAPAVVNIFTTTLTRREAHPFFSDPLFRRFFGEELSQPRVEKRNNLGSGVIVNKNGYIITNHHVIENASEIRVVLRDGRSMAARVVGTDPETDLAVLQASGEDFPVAQLGRSEDLQIGDVVLAIGNGFGLGQTVTMGIVSALGRQSLGLTSYDNFIQTDAAINPGNSGGALINPYGDVIGINTAIYTKSGGSEGVGFAIPAQLVNKVFKQIRDKGRVVRGWIGVTTTQAVTPELAQALGLGDAKGLLIAQILRNGPADKAGIKPGDVIQKVNGIEAKTARVMVDLVADIQPGEDVKIELTRDGNSQTVHVEVIERPTNLD